MVTRRRRNIFAACSQGASATRSSGDFVRREGKLFKFVTRNRCWDFDLLSVLPGLPQFQPLFSFNLTSEIPSPGRRAFGTPTSCEDELHVMIDQLADRSQQIASAEQVILNQILLETGRQIVPECRSPGDNDVPMR